LGEALQRVLGNAERFEACIADSDIQPDIGCDPRVCSRIDIRYQPAEKSTARLSIVDPQEHVCAEVWRRPRPQHGRLNLMQFESRLGCRKILADSVFCGQHGRIPFLSPGRSRARTRPNGRCGYATLSSSSSTALPILSSLFVSATVRLGEPTYQ